MCTVWYAAQQPRSLSVAYYR